MKAERLALHFADHGRSSDQGKPLKLAFSGLASKGESLWLVNDEGASLDQLFRQPDGSFAEHRRLSLADYLALPGEEAEELDLESLAIEEEGLWILGSHALVRKAPGGSALDPDAATERLSRIEAPTSRQLLARLPLACGKDGRWQPQPPDRKERPGALVKVKRKGSQLVKQLRLDSHLGPFTALPAKENGLDMEGLAVGASHVFLGLRGPVLRGWAVLLELCPEPPADGRLRLRGIGTEGERYLKHFLDLDGLGIRDLARRGDDLILLAGPTMDHDGPQRLYRWPEALVSARPTLVERSHLERVLDLPAPEGVDRAEGLTAMAYQGSEGLALVYDRPAAERRDPVAGRLCLDFYPWPAA